MSGAGAYVINYSHAIEKNPNSHFKQRIKLLKYIKFFCFVFYFGTTCGSEGYMLVHVLQFHGKYCATVLVFRV